MSCTCTMYSQIKTIENYNVNGCTIHMYISTSVHVHVHAYKIDNACTCTCTSNLLIQYTHIVYLSLLSVLVRLIPLRSSTADDEVVLLLVSFCFCF